MWLCKVRTDPIVICITLWMDFALVLVWGTIPLKDNYP